MNKLIAFVGGVVIGTVYSKQIKQVVNEYKEQLNQKEVKKIADIVKKQVAANTKLVGDDDSKSDSYKKIDGSFDPNDDYLV